jgi:hypothetical protein
MYVGQRITLTGLISDTTIKGKITRVFNGGFAFSSRFARSTFRFWGGSHSMLVYVDEYGAAFSIPSNADELEAIAQEHEAAVESWRITRDERRQERWNARREKDRQQAEEKAAKMPELLEAWRNGDNSLGYWDLHNLPAMLRIDGDEVETSLGARFPVSHAIRGLAFVRSVKASGNPYQSNGHTVHLGHYSIDSIDADGNVKAGCHLVTFAEIERIAPKLESATL